MMIDTTMMIAVAGEGALSVGGAGAIGIRGAHAGTAHAGTVHACGVLLARSAGHRRTAGR